MFPLEDKGTEWTSMKFSHDGKKLMICTDESVIRLVDAFEGHPLQSICAGYSPQKLRFEAAFSPDSQFVLSGSGEGLIHVWNAETGNKVCNINNLKALLCTFTVMFWYDCIRHYMQVCELNGNHSGAVHCVQFNPKYMMMATACSNMVRLNVNQNLEYVIAISIFE